MSTFKDSIKNVPVLGPMLAAMYRLVKGRKPFPGSTAYWESRYAEGGNSGIGSYQELAEFKAKVLNDFVRSHSIQDVIEFGCGDGNQLSLASYPRYVGLDVSTTVIEHCRRKFANDASKRFEVYGGSSFFKTNELRAELTLSLDVIYHLVEDAVFVPYMNDLFDASTRYVIVYSSDYDLQSAEHVRHRNVTKWIADNRKGCVLKDRIENPIKFDPRNPSDKFDVNFFIYEKS